MTESSAGVPAETVAELIERSSLGTPEAKAARESVSDELRAVLADHAGAVAAHERAVAARALRAVASLTADEGTRAFVLGHAERVEAGDE